MTSSLSCRGLIELDSSLVPANARPVPYETRGGVSAANAEFNGFTGSHPLHGFVLAVHEAFARHLALELCPDDFWSVIVQGIGQHVAKNPIKHRNKLVTHKEGKQLVRVVRDDMVRGRTTRDEWKGVIQELTQKTLEHVPDDSIVQHVQQTFTTTNEMHQLLYAGSILSTLQHYMDYRLHTLCGIPRIILNGTLQDWKDLLVRLDALALSKFDIDLATWDKALHLILERLLLVRQHMDIANGITAHDVNFFKHMYKFNSSSGGNMVSGWINGLFPYLGSRRACDSDLQLHLPGIVTKLTTDPLTDEKQMWKYERLGIIASDAFPTGLTDIPFVWEYLTSELPMTIYVGFDVPHIDDTCVRPQMGFAVIHNTM